MWGDEFGDIHILTFTAPVTQLFEKAFTNHRQTSKSRIYMQVSSQVVYGCTRRWFLNGAVLFLPDNDD